MLGRVSSSHTARRRRRASSTAMPATSAISAPASTISRHANVDTAPSSSWFSAPCEDKASSPLFTRWLRVPAPTSLVPQRQRWAALRSHRRPRPSASDVGVQRWGWAIGEAVGVSAIAPVHGAPRRPARWARRGTAAVSLPAADVAVVRRTAALRRLQPSRLYRERERLAPPSALSTSASAANSAVIRDAPNSSSRLASTVRTAADTAQVTDNNDREDDRHPGARQSHTKSEWRRGRRRGRTCALFEHLRRKREGAWRVNLGQFACSGYRRAQLVEFRAAGLAGIEMLLEGDALGRRERIVQVRREPTSRRRACLLSQFMGHLSPLL